jgi:chloramphenicol O-acetyltransferase
MSVNINGADMPTLTVFKMELQRISDLNLNINLEITDYMKSRINDIESYNES